MVSKKRVLILCPYPHGEAPSQRFRFEMHMPYMQSKGYAIRFRSFWSPWAWQNLYKTKHLYAIVGIGIGFIRRIGDVLGAHRYDLIFVHREATPMLFPFVEWWLSCVLKKPMIYDFDDAIWLHDAHVPLWKRFLKNPTKTRLLCKWATHVSAGNAFLAGYAKKLNAKVSVLPTIVDTDSIHNPKRYAVSQKKLFTIGWTGTHSTLRYLDLLWPVLERLAEQVQFRFLVIANCAPAPKYSWLVYHPWCKETEIQDLLQFDVGVMPLAEEAWSKGKCGFKIIQYLALGIPAVASPVGVNKALIHAKHTGYLCTHSSEWTQALMQLWQDDTHRKQMGKQGRQHIIANYSAKSQHKIFLDLIVRAMT